MNIDGYDFIDFGASLGSSFQFAQERLGGIRGVGIDISPEKVRQMRENGFDCLEGDITRLDLPSQSVRFVIMSHILEHLPDLATVEKVVAAGARLVTDFVYITGPYFDADDYLESHGLKFYWSDWTGHPCHLKVSDLERTLRKLGLGEATFLVGDEVLDSNHPSIHPLDSPPNQHDYDAEKHPPKPYVKFDRPIWREMSCIVRARPLDEMDQLLRARARALPLTEAKARWEKQKAETAGENPTGS